MNNKKGLKPVSSFSLAVLEEASPELKREIEKRYWSSVSDQKHADAFPREKYQAGVDFVMMFLTSFLKYGDPSLMEDQLEWSRDRLPQDNFSLEEIQRSFKIISKVFQDLLPEKVWSELNPYLTWMIERQQEVYAGDES